MKENELKELEKFAKSFLSLAIAVPSQMADKIKEGHKNISEILAEAGISGNSVVPPHLAKEFEQRWAKPTFNPVVNMKEGPFAYHVELEMPGIKKENINIEIKDSKLVVSGEKKHETRSENDNYIKLESTFGTFERSFIVGEVDKENISASMNDGILEIVLPKIKKAEKKIEIK